MAIEFLVDLACPVKRTLEAPALMRALEARARAREAARRAEEAGDARPPSEIPLRLVRADGEGGERVEVTTVGALLRAADGLEALAPSCAGCRAALVKEPFGCYGVIGYPIDHAAEEFVMDRLPPVLGTVGGAFLVRAVSELGFDGAPVARMRAEGETFFESRRPVTTRWADGDASWAVTSDVLLHLMFFAGPGAAITPNHALLLALVLGLVPHAVAPEHVQESLRDPDALAALLEPVFIPRALEGTQVGAFARFLAAVRLGLLLGCPVLVDA